MGAVATGGVRVLNDAVVEALNLPESLIESVAAAEEAELARREREYRDGRPAPDVAGQTVILVDDGLATGSTMRAAIRALRLQQPKGIVVAVPTAAPSTCDEIGYEVDQIFCLRTPEPFYAVGLWYVDFSQTTDDQVRDLLRRAASARQA